MEAEPVPVDQHGLKAQMEEAVMDLRNAVGPLGQAVDLYPAIGMVVLCQSIGRVVPGCVKEAAYISAPAVGMDPIAFVLVNHRVRKGRERIGFPEDCRVIWFLRFRYEGEKGRFLFPFLKGTQRQGQPCDFQIQPISGIRT